MIKKGIVYFTDNRLDANIMLACQKQLNKISIELDIPIISVSLKPIDFGTNLVMNAERGYLTMFRQILRGLENSSSEIVFMAEHDILYNKEHFTFIPDKKDVYYYDRNNYKIRYSDGQALFYTCEQTLGLCAYRELLLQHYRERVRRVEEEGFSRKMGFEPGKHKLPNGVDNYGWDFWMSVVPNLDIRHDKNLTENRWSQDQFKSQKNCQNWQMSDSVPFWGKTKGNFDKILKGIIDD
jgi:hypothetical protein